MNSVLPYQGQEHAYGVLPEHCSEQADSDILSVARNMCMVCCLSMQDHGEFVDGVPLEHVGLEHVDGVPYEMVARSKWMFCYLRIARSRWMLIYLNMARSRWMLIYLNMARSRWMLSYLRMARAEGC